jgi:membrane associated rhomboid family serine protease
VSTTNPAARRALDRTKQQREGLGLLAGIVAVMWLVEVINTLDSNGLDGDGLYARNLGRIWGIFTFPFIHASFQHLLGNTVPFLFLGGIIAFRGAARLARVTILVILIGGIGTWLISPSSSPTIGASGVVFGYAAYLLARGFFDRNIMEILVGAIVGVVWGAALLSSLLPHQGVSWQAHACGAVAGILVAWLISARDRRGRPAGRPQRDPLTDLH